jgi:hypothetical protein
VRALSSLPWIVTRFYRHRPRLLDCSNSIAGGHVLIVRQISACLRDPKKKLLPQSSFG